MFLSSPLNRLYPPPWAACLAGVTLALAFPPTAIWPLSFCGLVPLLYAIDEKEFKDAFVFGFLAGLVQTVILIYWLYRVLTFYGGLHMFLALPAFLLLSSYLAVYTGLFTLGLVFCRKYLNIATGSMRWIILGSAIFTGLEYLRGTFLSGFPWQPLGASLVSSLSLVQFSDIFGTGGLTFIVVLVNLSLFAAAKQYRIGGLKTAIFPVILVMAVLSGLWIYGQIRLTDIRSKVSEVPSKKVVVVQGSIEQPHKWDPAHRERILRSYQDLTLKAVDEKPWLIIWPETAVPFFFLWEEQATDWLRSLVSGIKTPLLFGSPAFVRDGKEESYYNRVYLLDSQGEVLDYYDKVHLVPYGEYVPLKRFFPYIKKITRAVGDYTGGEPGKLLKFEGQLIGVLICFEALFPDLARSQVSDGAAFLVNPSNDAWFGRSSAPRQLLYQAVLRAVENRRTMIRAVNTGISAIILPTGEIAGR
ncbi:MAG: apolipoprotein N-acyltransferase, partial [Deltaproteobacteria bacterium]|nr:apolipoprotein N-acyltransferase [Deltaproteobacteria bacterium]